MQSSRYLTLNQAAVKLPGRPHSSAVWRWCRRGIKTLRGNRIFLEHIRLGGQIFVTMEAVEEFGRQLAAADRTHFIASPVPGDGSVVPNRTDSDELKAVANARRDLARNGF